MQGLNPGGRREKQSSVGQMNEFYRRSLIFAFSFFAKPDVTSCRHFFLRVQITVQRVCMCGYVNYRNKNSTRQTNTSTYKQRAVLRSSGFKDPVLTVALFARCLDLYDGAVSIDFQYSQCTKYPGQNQKVLKPFNLAINFCLFTMIQCYIIYVFFFSLF